VHACLLVVGSVRQIELTRVSFSAHDIASRAAGLLGKWVKYNEIFFIYSFFFMNSPTGQTRRRIFTLDGSNDADSRKDVPFGGFADIASHFGGKIPQKPQFWGVDRRFQAKRAKY